MPPYRCNRKKPKKKNLLFPTNAEFKVQSCVYQYQTDDGTTKTTTFEKKFENGENIAGSEWPPEFENTMNFIFNENDSSDGEVCKTATNTKRCFVEMELVQEQPPQSCCVIL